MNIIGVNSGTSVDSIDICLCKITNQDMEFKIKLIFYDEIPFQKNEKELIFNLMNSKNLSAKDFCKGNFIIGKYFSNAINLFLKKFKINSKEIDLIASHGQTIWHEVDEITGKVHSTLQMGEASVIAQDLNIPVVSDFRTDDVANDGQGAPLTSIFDYLILRDKKYWRICQNIGGISNLTVLPPLNVNSKIFSFDTGPGNVIIDELIRIITNNKEQYDKNGNLASKGKINMTLLFELLQLDYFKIQPPKSTGKINLILNKTLSR
jgi:anhydro-N-acetylmuramic acid kinase